MKINRKSAIRLAALSGAAALSFAAANPAFAAMTVAGTGIVNNADVEFSVGGVAQTKQSASNTVYVDRKVDLTVTLDTTPSPIVVNPGQTNVVTTWTVTNNSNDKIDIGLAATNKATGDDFDVTMVKYQKETSPGSGTWTDITYLDEIAAESSVKVRVLVTVPSTATNTQLSDIFLTVTAKKAGTAATEGAVIADGDAYSSTGSATILPVSVLADAASVNSDVAKNGQYAATAQFKIAAPVLTIRKISRIISDPVNGTTNPKAIPGAVIEYCIVVANGTGGATATNVNVFDSLPAEVKTSTPATDITNIFVDGTVSGTAPNETCSGGTAGTVAANYTATPTAPRAGPTVYGTLSNLAAGDTKTLRFQVPIK